jgi:hypothetical protein
MRRRRGREGDEIVSLSQHMLNKHEKSKLNFLNPIFYFFQNAEYCHPHLLFNHVEGGGN